MTGRSIPRPGIATPYLKGNCRPCEACALQREALGPPGFTHRFTRCQVCDGWGFVPLTDAEIVAATVAEVTRFHRWPAPHPIPDCVDIGPDGPETATLGSTDGARGLGASVPDQWLTPRFGPDGPDGPSFARFRVRARGSGA